jgi:ABC-type sugar transport system ATPase subunit
VSAAKVDKGSGRTKEIPPLIALRGISKVFGHVQALKNVDLRLAANEVVALVGDNGAGKSTLTKVLSGFYQPTSGTISVDGKVTHFAAPIDAVRAGVASVYQDLALVEGRSVAANLFLGREFVRGRFIDRRRMIEEAKKAIHDLHADIPSVEVPAFMLSGGQRQAVAIGRAILQGGRLIVMDEPTAALGVVEAERVLALVNELRRGGKSVLIVSHNLRHIWTVADRIIVLHRGELAGERKPAECSIEDVVKLIVYGSPSATDGSEGVLHERRD